MNHNLLAAEIHAANKHWWHHPATGERLDRNKGELLMLMVSEVAEAMEGERKNLMDDKLPHRRMAEVELADVLIRLYDYAGGFGCDLSPHVTVAHLHLPDMPDNKAAALLQIVRTFTDADSTPNGLLQTFHLARAIALIDRYATAHGYDLNGAMKEKREYNSHRADHKAESRLAANGKKF